ncbi:MAG: glycoside hydrolase family 5 protein [Spirochaetales bacterium]|nr:glycoside hydrolase family 5 protein [Spirochaetales bacterium]
MKAVNFMLLAVFLFFTCSSGPDGPQDVVLPEEYYTDIHGWNDDHGLDATVLGRGINLGNYLEAPRDGDDDGEGNWTGGRKITQADIERIAAAGFATVRIPCRWSEYLESGDENNNGIYYELMTIGDSSYDRLARVQEILGWTHGAGLRAVLNVHHYDELMSYTTSGMTLAGHTARLGALWGQLCAAFPLSEYPADELVFELLNEPHGDIGYGEWNDLLAGLCEVVWTDNAASQVSGGTMRRIMVGTANWGGVPGLQNLELPAACTADNTIITVHYYEPFHFTHQGAEWVDGSDAWIGERWLGTEEDQAPLLELLDSIVTWNTAGYEVFVGEFGVYSKYAEPSDQKAWTAFICRESEERGYSWAYWEYAAGFGAYDPAEEEWKEQLISALIPADL